MVGRGWADAWPPVGGRLRPVGVRWAGEPEHDSFGGLKAHRLRAPCPDYKISRGWRSSRNAERPPSTVDPARRLIQHRHHTDTNHALTPNASLRVGRLERLHHEIYVHPGSHPCVTPNA